ncbi:MAG: VOC family protein [Cyclobacteriaceae bacterium]|nr:VOC family protein [Cyclobacteriaceae bacterium HetDA_MAG_MS6]
MDLGKHYNALNVKDIKVSRDFYQKLGFVPISNGGSVEEKWLVMANGAIKIGLFEGMLPKNTLTFNPTNARQIYNELSKQGVTFDSVSASLQEEKGPCYFMLADPDGNPILVDQHEA